MWDKFGRIAWNPFHLQTLRETFHTVNPCDPVSTRGWFLPCGFVNKFLIWGRKNGGCTDIFRSCAYQDWVCHVGVTMIRWSIFSCRIFLRTWLIKLSGGKAKLYSLSQGWRNASVAILPGFDLHAIYQGSWWQSLDANRCRAGCLMCVTISWKTKTSSFHSELSLAFRDSQSACTFRALGRYSTGIAFCLLIR